MKTQFNNRQLHLKKYRSFNNRSNSRMVFMRNQELLIRMSKLGKRKTEVVEIAKEEVIEKARV